MQLNAKAWALALAAGALFGLGLVVSGMTQPAKVIGFLNVAGLFDAARFGAWDASLAFVMGGAVLVTLVAFAVTPPNAAHPQRRPWLAPRFRLPTKQDVDMRLIVGAAVFGVGWGLIGYCPGPAITVLGSGSVDAAVVVLAMLAGMGLARFK